MIDNVVENNNHEDSDIVLWNNKIENVVRGIGENCKNYMKMHMTQARRSNTIYNRLTIAGIVFGPLGGIFTVINEVSGIESTSVLSIVEIILGFLSGVIVAIIKFGKYDEVSNSNQTTAARYTSLYGNVQRQLSLNKDDRMHALKYLDWLQTKYDELILSAPLISTHIHTKFMSKECENNTKPYDNVININLETDPVNKVVQPIQIKRSNTIVKSPEINKYSDKMLEYEMQRMFSTNK